MEINVLDRAWKKWKGWVGHPHTYDRNLVYVSSVSEAVTGILRKLHRKHKITVLRFFGHGRPGLQAVGGDETPSRDQCIGYLDGGPGFLGGSQLLHLRGRFAKATL